MDKYFIYRIENPDKQCYYGKSNSTNKRYNPIHYFMEANKKNKDQYKKLAESIEKHGRNRHVLIKSIQYQNLSKDEATDHIYRIINDEKFNSELNEDLPDRIECDYCHKKVIETQIDRHYHIFCPKLMDDEIKTHFGD